MTKTRSRILVALVLAGFAGGALAETSLTDVIKQSFKARGQATMDRIDQDPTQAACSTGTAPDQKTAARIVADNRASIREPGDGNYLGDWKNGEAIAQNGKGLQYSDDPAEPAGGNCYACHEMSPAEIAYGTIGPSLKNYGKLRGSSPEMLKYTWDKLYNAEAFVPCSLMPRFGTKGILTEQQMRDVMAYLFDPASPVNQ